MRIFLRAPALMKIDQGFLDGALNDKQRLGAAILLDTAQPQRIVAMSAPTRSAGR